MEELESVFRNMTTKRLDEVAEVISGKSARSYDYQEDGIPYLRGRDIQDGQIVKTEVYLSVDIAEQFARQLVQEGDILLTKNFGQRKLALVTEANLPAIASNGLFIIRPFGVSEKYLYRYLTSKTGNAVFNEQLEEIEKGVVFPSISLKDLKTIQVPIFDEYIMQDLEQIDRLSEEEKVETALRIIEAFRRSASLGSRSKIAQETEKQVYSDLISAGWDPSRFTNEFKIPVDERSFVASDFLYLLPDNTKVVIEVKLSLTRKAKEWVRSIAELLSRKEKCFYILTTGYYYEVHVSGKSASLKLLHAPKIDEIIEWERGLD